MQRHWHLSRSRDDRGAAAVEFALVVPILLLVVFGIVNLGVVMAQQISLNNGARQAARFAVVDGRTCTEIQDEGKASASTVGMEASAVPTPVITRNGSPAPCPSPCSSSVPGDNIKVTMTRSAAWLVSFPPFTSGNAPILSGEAEMRCEFS